MESQPTPGGSDPGPQGLGRSRPAVLTIAGSDSGAGAGLQVDLGALAAHGVHGTTAVTAVTAQNSRSVTAVDPVSPEMVAAQIRAVFDDFEIGAIKTGMLATAAIVTAVCDAIESHPAPLVVDPVIAATSGRRLLDEDGVAVVRDRLLRRARVVTPNRFEAEVLAEQPIATVDDARLAAARIRDRGAAAVLVTGGHFDTDEAVDVLDDGGVVIELRGPRLDARQARGTGCTLSAAIAAGLAAGLPLAEAAGRAKRYVEGAIGHAAGAEHEPGPLHHFWRNERQ